jgi:serine/threonine-protein kinase HipA
MSSHLNQVEVVLDLERLGGPQRMGVLYRQTARGADVYSFEFDAQWLARKDSISLDPDLLPVVGRTYARSHGQFGVFLDSSPDRWGRTLMQRREAILASNEKRASRTLTDWDYLLGVHDSARMGALRFRVDSYAPYLDNALTNATPPITSLRELQTASLALEANDSRGAESDQWLMQLLGPGSSLGGARPKASVVDEQGRLCIAKFPSANDQRDIGAWEIVAHRLATRAGIRVPEARVLKLTPDGHTFITRRFDRTITNGRLAFVSAMTLLQRSDGDHDASYLELVELLQRSGAQTKVDCQELFRRVVFNICISNTDDHLRNHGFLVDAAGIVLSPAFDMNPNPEKSQLTLAIDETNASLNLEVAMAVANVYGLSAAGAQAIVTQVCRAVGHWRAEANAIGISRSEQDRMAVAFRAV